MRNLSLSPRKLNCVLMPLTLIDITLPFIGNVSLAGSILAIFFLCFFAVVAFEFVNGFHDTANAVATVIYTKALKPVVAVPWSGLWNFLGVFTGGVAVAMGILKLLPLNELMALPTGTGASFVLAVLLTSIVWNLGTWWLGIPCSSSHTLIGAMIGASIAFTLYYHTGGVNWEKAEEIGLSLILSPLFGFGVAVLLMLFLKNVVKAKILFHIPAGENDRPPIVIRVLLIITCTLVSFFHGSNDGQKGVGLLMLILIAFLPGSFALNRSFSNSDITSLLTTAQQHLNKIQTADNEIKNSIVSLDSLINKTKSEIAGNSDSSKQRFLYRRDIQAIVKTLHTIAGSDKINIQAADKTAFISAAHHLNTVTDYAPVWVIATISISLGIGTMIGWKKIVLTIGEKIGNEHLNYAQGASAEIVAAGTIGLSTGFGLPVSTTHVLSSGIAGAMVASKGAKNLNGSTLKSIAMAWILTLPVCIILAMILFALFHLLV